MIGKRSKVDRLKEERGDEGRSEGKRELRKCEHMLIHVVKAEERRRNQGSREGRT